MKCPQCDKKVDVLPPKPDFNAWPSATTTVDFGVAQADTFHVSTMPAKSSEVFKCVNEECWVTRIEVDWGQS